MLLFSRLFPSLLGLALLAIYWPGMHGGFAFDDYSNFVNHPALRLADVSLASMLAAANSGVAGPLGRPLSMLSFSLNFFFFGDGPLSFKLTNLGIHYVNALLVMVLVRQIANGMLRGLSHERAMLLATCVSAIWALHPINAMPVLLVVQRMTSLSALFILAGLCLYLSGRQAKSNLGKVAIAFSLLVCWPASVYSKETGLLFPLYVALCEALVLGSFKSIRPIAFRAGVWVSGTLVLALCWANWGIVTSGYRVRDFTLIERLYTEPRVLWFYVQQMLWPMPRAFGLYHDDIAISRGLLSPLSTLFAVLGWVATIGLAYWQRKRWPFFTLGVFWFLVSHLLESTLLPLEIAHEHRNYLATIGLLLWISNLLLPATQLQKASVTKVALLIGFVVLCGGLTGLRSSQWGDDFNRRQVEAFNHPESARANYEAAISLLENTFEVGRGNPQAYFLVLNHLQAAATLNPNSKLAQIGLIYLDCIAGKPQNTDAIANLLTRFATQPFSYEDRNTVQSLSPLLVQNKLCMHDQDVQTLLNAGLSNPLLDGPLRGAFYAVAMDYAMVRLQSPALALQYARAAVVSAPSSVAFSGNLIHLLLRSVQIPEARDEYSRVSALPIANSDKASVANLKNLIESSEHHAPSR